MYILLPSYTQTIQECFNLYNCFNDTNKFHPEGWTIYGDQNWLVDYMFISNNIKVSNQIPTTIDNYPSIATHNPPSDHFPLSCTIELVKT